MYKSCLVPQCKSTTIRTPDKLYFPVPHKARLRNKWCKIIKKYNRTPLSTNSSLYCCEDHFDVETDTENYIQYKLVGGRLRLKKHVFPHKFDCQKPPKKIIPRLGYEKRRRIEFLQRVMSKDICHEDLTFHPIELVECSTNLDQGIYGDVNSTNGLHEISPDKKEIQNNKPIECSQTDDDLKICMAIDPIDTASHEMTVANKSNRSSSIHSLQRTRTYPNILRASGKRRSKLVENKTNKLTKTQTKIDEALRRIEAPSLLNKATLMKPKINENTNSKHTILDNNRIQVTSATKPPQDEFYFFAMSVAAQLRNLPLKVALEMQVKIQDGLCLARTQSLNSQTNNILIMSDVSEIECNPLDIDCVIKEEMDIIEGTLEEEEGIDDGD